MQQYAIHPFRKLPKCPVRQDLPPAAEELRAKLEHCEEARSHGMPWERIRAIFGVSRSKSYRISKKVRDFGITGYLKQSNRPRELRQSGVAQAVIDLVLRLRKESPTYGKAKIAIIAKRDHGVNLSESTIGRILKKLFIERKISRSASAARAKRKRCFNGGHAQRWQYGMKGLQPGGLLQMDHMTVTKNGICFKRFQAWDPVTKVIVASAKSNATSSAAAAFLRKVTTALPFALQSVQVDGGSEFKKDFEAECQKLNLPLYVLPVKRPQCNGGVERGNRIFREEFYARADLLVDSVGAMNADLQKAVAKYNSYRPHSSLKGMTPYEYNEALFRAAA